MWRLLLLVFGLVAVTPVQAETILFESGTLGQTGIPISDLLNQNVLGTNVNQNVFAGVRFELTQPVETTQVGGHFVANGGGDFFGAIVELDDENDFPDSGDLASDDVLGHAELTFPTPSDEVFGNLYLTLQAGSYALVFGSGLFGADGSGVAVRNGMDVGDPSYISFQPTVIGWRNTDATFNYSLSITGRIIPEPSSLAIAVIAFLFSLQGRRQHC